MLCTGVTWASSPLRADYSMSLAFGGLPSNATPGQPVSFTVTVTNTGSSPWSGGTDSITGADRHFYIECADSDTNTTEAAAWVDGLMPGQQTTVTFSLTLPHDESTHTCSFNLSQANTGYFGNPIQSPPINLAVSGPPAAFSALAATNVTTGGFTPQWQGSLGATHFLLDISRQADFSTLEKGFASFDPGWASSCPITGLASGITYYYRVKAVNSRGTTSSTVLSVTTAPVPGTSTAARSRQRTASIRSGVAGGTASSPVAGPTANLDAGTVVLHITGSTNYRRSLYAAIIANLTSPQAAYVSGPFPGIANATQAVFSGNWATTGQPVIIQCCLSGSIAGVEALTRGYYPTTRAPSADPSAGGQAWLSNSNGKSSVSVDTTYNFSGGSAVSAGSATYDSAAWADVAFSDAFQSDTLYPQPILKDTGLRGVGVVPYVWIKGSHADLPPTAGQAYSRLTNMTVQAAKAFLGNGFLPLSMLTGIVGDHAYDAVLTGRDNDSGSRFVTFAETDYGVFLNPVQCRLNTNGANISSLTYFAGTDGYSSGVQLVSALALPAAGGSVDNETATGPVNGTQGLPYIPISYLGIADAELLINNSSRGSQSILTYQGVPYTTQNLQEGKYTFWAYEHFYYLSSFGGDGKTYADALANRIKTVDAIASAYDLPLTGPPVIGSPLSASATAGQPFSYQIASGNRPGSYSASGLPAGLSLSASGVIAGIPTAGGTYTVSISATNANGTDSRNLTLTIAGGGVAPVITSSLTASGVAGTSFSYQITASNQPTSYNASGLPPGLSINTTGLISGTPTTAGSYTVHLSATNASGTGNQDLALTIASAPPPPPPPPPPPQSPQLKIHRPQ